MLEKIGLPAKPSMRGSNWVVDASNCQGCASQFSFINRKHHCRRCGGLFCNTCTQQRMTLRGQGDSAVRICDPCKKLEEAARFQLRHGYKNRTAKAISKLSPEKENEIIKNPEGGTYPSPDIVTHTMQNESVEVSPEDMRKQAVEEKQKYRILKAEGKSGEALQAFKRGKELERQADALEISIRKNRRLASAARKTEDEADAERKEFSRKGKQPKDELLSELKELGWCDGDLNYTNKKTENLSAEGELSNLLKENPEISSAERASSGIDKTQVIAHKRRALMLKKDGKMAEAKEELKRAKILEKQLEEQELLANAEDSDDELSALIRSINDGKEDVPSFSDIHGSELDFDQYNNLDVTADSDLDVTHEDMNDPEILSTLKSFGWNENVDVPVNDGKLKEEVLTMKNEAVKQKKAGNMADALALLKQAKLLERGNPSPEKQISESGSSMDNSKSVNESFPLALDLSSRKPQRSKAVVQRELLNLKKKALALRREGRVEEAEEELKKGKDLEQKLEEMDSVPKLIETSIGARSIPSPTPAHQDLSLASNLSDEHDAAEVTEQDMVDPSLLLVLEDLGWKEDTQHDVEQDFSTPSESHEKLVYKPPMRQKMRASNKAEIQRELLNIKRKSLLLRRQGKPEEAMEALKRAKDLEIELAEADIIYPSEYPESVSGSDLLPQARETENPIKRKTDMGKEETTKVIEQELKDADQSASLSVSEKLGRNQDVENANTDSSVLLREPVSDDNTSQSVMQIKSKADIQRELLSIKRKSLALRRQGKSEEAMEALKCAKDLEDQLSNTQVTHPSGITRTTSDGIMKQDSNANLQKERSYPSNVPVLIDLLTGDEEKDLPDIRVNHEKNTKCSAVQLDPLHCSEKGNISSRSILGDVERTEQEIPQTNQIPVIEAKLAHEFITLKEQILARKRKAILLKREGKLAEAREELREAKLLEKSLQEDNQQHDMSREPQHADDVSSQKSPIHVHHLESGAEDSSIQTGKGVKQENIQGSSPETQKAISSRDRFRLQQESLAHKRQALKLRREGRMEESEAEYELAKRLESQIEELDSQKSNAREVVEVEVEADGGGGIECIHESQKPISSKDRFRLQQESLAHKRRAMKLRREGKMEESEAEYELGKRLESQIEALDSSTPSSSKTKVKEDNDGNDAVDVILDPQLKASLKAIGWQESEFGMLASTKPEAKLVEIKQESRKERAGSNNSSINSNKSHLEEQIKAEKRRALNLKHAGKQSQALDALRSAKRLEKQLLSLV